MGVFDQFPYTNFHELNLDWILQALKEIEKTMDQFVSINALKYADPIQWNITTQYEKNTIVIEPNSGTAYISVQAVPAGVSIANTDYWTVVFDLGMFVVRAAKNLATKYEEDTTTTATQAINKDEWFVWGDTLYKALSNIIAGDQFVIGSNIDHFTIESVTGHIEDLTTVDKSNLVAAINEVAAEVLGKIGNLDDLHTTDKSTIVDAINDVLDNFIGNLTNLQTTDKSSVVNSINDIVGRFTNINIVNVKDYGAVGDGVENDTNAFDNAFTASDVVYVPNGSYLLDAQYVMPDDKILLGESRDGVILLVSGQFSFQIGTNDIIKNITFNGNGSTGVLRADTVDGFTLDNILVIGTSSDYGVSIYMANQFSINNIEAKGFTTDNISISDCTNSIITKLISSAAGRYGFVIGNSNNIVLSNSKIHDNTLSGVVCVSSEKLILVGNLYTNNGYHGVQFNTCSFCTYSSSVSSGNSYSGYDMYSSISCKMIGCQSYDNGSMGLEVDTLAFNNSITGNSIRKNGSCGITLYRSPRNIIVGNDIIDNGQRGDLSGEGFSATPSGIWIHDDNTGLSRENIVNGNQIGDDQDTHTQYNGIQIEAGVLETVITDNNFYGHITAGITAYDIDTNASFVYFNNGYDKPGVGKGVATLAPNDPDVTAVSGGPLYSSNDGFISAQLVTSNLTITCGSLDLTAHVGKQLIAITDAFGLPQSGLSMSALAIALIVDGGGTTTETVTLQIDPTGLMTFISNENHTGITTIYIQPTEFIFPASLTS